MSDWVSHRHDIAHHKLKGFATKPFEIKLAKDKIPQITHSDLARDLKHFGFNLLQLIRNSTVLIASFDTLPVELNVNWTLSEKFHFLLIDFVTMRCQKLHSNNTEYGLHLLE